MVAGSLSAVFPFHSYQTFRTFLAFPWLANTPKFFYGSSPAQLSQMSSPSCSLLLRESGFLPSNLARSRTERLSGRLATLNVTVRQNALKIWKYALFFNDLKHV